jgi:hypothetical protein
MLCQSFFFQLLNFLENSMSLVPGTAVRLPDGREGVVIPASIWFRDRVLVKVKGGRKSWFKASDCIPTSSVA